MKQSVTSQPSVAPDGQTRAEYAYQVIKREIVQCELAPGSQVTEAQLAHRYDVGRAAVRSALNRLYQDRLVQPVPRKGYVVAPITLNGVRDLFGVRLLLEPAAAQLAAGRADIKWLRSLNQQLREMRNQMGDQESTAIFLRFNAEFHVTVASMSGNDRLTEILAGLLDEMDRLLHFGFMLRDYPGTLYHELHESKHDELIEALRAGDGEQAERAATDQIFASQKRVVDALISSSSLQSVSLTMP